jgi:hypothetical protein
VEKQLKRYTTFLLLLISFPSLASAWASHHRILLDDDLPASKLASIDLSDRRFFELDPLTIGLDSSIDEADSAYIRLLLQQIMPHMITVAGNPLEIDTLNIQIDTEAPYSYYSRSYRLISMRHAPYSYVDNDRDDDGRMGEDLRDGRDNDGDGEIDEERIYNPYFDGTFIHEMGHAFTYQAIHNVTLLPWTWEGIAEAIEYLVIQRVGLEVPERRFTVGDFHSYTGCFDLLNYNDAQIGGGTRTLINRQYYSYEQAASMFLIPALSELHSNPDGIHPIASLMASLREEADGNQPSFYSAIDRAWTISIDGITPPSRWLRRNSLDNRFLRDGYFIKIFPLGYQGCLNPDQLGFVGFHREDGVLGRHSPRGPLKYLNLHGSIAAEQNPGTSIVSVPDLQLGAYRVEMTETFANETATGATWILITPSGRKCRESQDGLTVIFVGSDGLPVHIPDLHVNGRIVEQVPGGVVVAPTSPFDPPAAYTFLSGDKVLGTVTAPHPLSRVVPLFVDGENPAGVIRWLPYRPAIGDTLSIWLSPSDSALDPNESDITLNLSSALGTITLTPEPDESGQLCARTVLPDMPGRFNIQAFAGSSSHGYSFYSCSDCDLGYRFIVSADPEVTIQTVSYTNLELQVLFSHLESHFDLDLYFRNSIDEAWERYTGMIRIDRDNAQSIAWPIAPQNGNTCYIRITFDNGTGSRELFHGSLGSLQPESQLIAFAPFPNPSPDGIRWRLEVPSTSDCRFDVFDVSGRSVFGPVFYRLEPGTREIRWNGICDDRPMTTGVCYLRLSGPNINLQRQILLIRNRP